MDVCTLVFFPYCVMLYFIRLTVNSSYYLEKKVSSELLLLLCSDKVVDFISVPLPCISCIILVFVTCLVNVLFFLLRSVSTGPTHNHAIFKWEDYFS